MDGINSRYLSYFEISRGLREKGQQYSRCQYQFSGVELLLFVLPQSRNVNESINKFARKLSIQLPLIYSLKLNHQTVDDLRNGFAFLFKVVLSLQSVIEKSLECFVDIT